MSKASERQLIGIAALLRSLRKAVDELERIELAEVDTLTGQQTVDSQQSLTQCFGNLQTSIAQMEDTLAAVAEATGDIGKL